MKNQNITIEQLAVAMNKSLFTKSATPRIYLNEGFNTKKMKTTTYIYEVGGEFKISCFIDCPSQPMAWINSQKESVIEGVENMIADTLKKAENPEKYANMPYTHSVAGVCKEKVVVVAPVVVVAKEVKAPLVFIGETFEHGRFGIGKKISETADTIQLYFENFGEKNLLKKFANLKSI